MKNHSTTSCNHQAPVFIRDKDGGIIVSVALGDNPRATIDHLRDCRDALIRFLDDYPPAYDYPRSYTR